jgi:transcriptional regulator with XRE-family HTH domain
MANNDLNRLKVVLVEQHKKAKWLAEQMGKDPATISKWCTNTAQPSLETIKRIAEILQVKMSDLVNNEQL